MVGVVGLVGAVEMVRLVEVNRVVEVVNRHEENLAVRSQQEEEQGRWPPYDHAASGW